MPNRLIRDTCRSSVSLDQLSDFAERVFWRLVVSADDYGRFPADPMLLAAMCFPRRYGQITFLARLSAALTELEQEHVMLYEIDNRPYGVFRTWEKWQKKRASHSKYPAPPAPPTRSLPGAARWLARLAALADAPDQTTSQPLEPNQSTP